jgi:uncharacterized protein (TIGR03089 family)
MSAQSFAEALRDQVGRHTGDPAVTFYDHATGERVELSYVTYANWVAKTASFLQDEVGLERGSVVAVDLPTHWLGPVWLGAAWSLGVAASDRSQADRADLVVCGPDAVERYAAGRTGVVACSLLPMGTRFRTALPPGVTDFGEVVWSQPDTLLVHDPASSHDLAWTDGIGDLDQSALLSLPDARAARVITEVPACSRRGLAEFTGPLLSGHGTVWVAGAPSPEQLARLARTERAEPEGR